MSRTLLAALCAAAALASPPARAQFEGRLDYRLSGFPDGKGGKGTTTSTTWISAAGARSETAMPMPDGKGGTRPTKVVTLMRSAEPKKTWIVNDERKSYAVISADDVQAASTAKVEVKKLGSDRVGGRSCEKARITSRDMPGSHEVCVSRELGKLSIMSRMGGSGRDDLPAALKAAGLDGVPVRWRSLDEQGQPTFTMELTSAKPQKVPAGMLAVPAGYEETGMASVFASPEQARQMEEGMKQMEQQMKNMSPEQRKQMEDVMKKYGTGGK